MTTQRLCGHKKSPRIWGIGLMFSHALLPLLETKLRSGTMGICFLILIIALYGHKKSPRVWGIGPMFSHAFSLLLETKLRSGTMAIFFNFDYCIVA